MSATANPDPIPVSDPIVQQGQDSQQVLGASWFRWLSQLVSRVTVTARIVTTVHRTGLGAAVLTSTLTIPGQAGPFRVNWTAQVTRAATTSSSITVTIGWTANGVACTKVFTAMTGNTTASADGDSVTIRSDASQPITYAIAYASVGGTPMTYMADVVVEQLS
jgi:hypothetical protein